MGIGSPRLRQELALRRLMHAPGGPHGRIRVSAGDGLTGAFGRSGRARPAAGRAGLRSSDLARAPARKPRLVLRPSR
jgi:hypothetical protein